MTGKQGATPNGITLKSFTDNEIREIKQRDSWRKYIEWHPFTLNALTCRHDHFVQLAVDADWEFPDAESETTIPNDLLYVWADMVTFYSDQRRDVKSESILTHSYTKFDNKTNGEQTTPEMLAANRAVLQRYAGPRGTVIKQRVA